MMIRPITLLIACGIYFCCACAMFAQAPTQRPVNRLGAHFDQSSSNRSAHLDEFRQAVAETSGTYYSSTQADKSATGHGPENNPGMPLDSPAQRQFEQRLVSPTKPSVQSSTSATLTPVKNSSSTTPRVRNVGFDPPQENNSSGGSFNPTSKPTNNQLGQASDANVINVDYCKVEFINDIEIPAQEAGQIKNLYVKEGDSVAAGKIVGRIDDELFLRMLQQAQFRYEIAEKKATDQTSIKAAENEIELQGVIYNRTRDLRSKGSAPQAELDEAKFRYMLAGLKKQAAINEIDSANGEAKVELARMKEVEEHIRRHTMAANFDGYVIEIFKHPLEWVNAGDPVMRVARMDRLRVSGVVDPDQVNAYQLVGRPVTVTVKLAGEKFEYFEGKVETVAMERESGKVIRFKAEVDNRPIQGHWVLQPNTDVTMKVSLAPTETNATVGGTSSLPSR